MDLLLKDTAHTQMKVIGYRWIKKGWNRIAMYLERLRTQVLKSLEGFLMYAHYGCVGTIPT